MKSHPLIGGGARRIEKEKEWRGCLWDVATSFFSSSSEGKVESDRSEQATR